MRWGGIIGVVCAASGAAAECPPPLDIADRLTTLIDEIRVVPNEDAARPISSRMWALWLTAPDTEAQALLDRGIALLRVADYDRAREHFDELIAYCPDYAEGYNQRAFASYLSGRYAEALVDIDRALARSPRHVGALSGKALTLFELDRVPDGQAALRQALALNPWLSERALLIEPPGEDL